MSQFIRKVIMRALLFSIIIISSNTNIFSCSTPVFRYALEMWAAYPYVIEVIHDGDLTSAQQQALDILKDAASSDIASNLKIIEKVESNTTGGPIIQLAFPEEHHIPGTLWTGSLSKENVEKIINSPSRKLALENIRRGDAAVWLFLESGNAERDEKQFKILDEELIRLSKTLKLSETATDVAGKVLDIKVINTGVNFSLVRINRNDPLEEVFIQILLGTEADLQFFKSAPIAFPMFGQGRVLYALLGNGIKSKNIETACSTIIGWCSCTIKDDNPGTDLLFMANWDNIIGDSSWIQPEEVPDITSLSSFVSDDSEVVEIYEVKNEIPEPIESLPVAKVEESMVAESVPSVQVEEVSKLVLEPAKVNNRVLASSVNESQQDHAISPLIRNSLIAFVLFSIIIAAALFIMKRKGV